MATECGANDRCDGQIEHVASDSNASESFSILCSFFDLSFQSAR